MNYYCCIFLLHLVAVGAGGVEVGSSPCWRWAVRGLILRRLPVAVVVVLSVVGSSRPAGGGVPILRTWWAPSACLSWWTSPCCWSCCCSIWSAARPPSVGWASPWCSSRWWSPRWGGDWHRSFRGTDFCSPLPLWCLLFWCLYFILLSRLAVSASFLFGFLSFECRLLLGFLWVAVLLAFSYEGNWWWWSLDFEFLLCCCEVCVHGFLHLLLQL